MKVAFAADNDQISPHFGRCSTYVLVDFEEGQIAACEDFRSPGHEPGVLPSLLHERGVECIVAGGMGGRAQQLFDQYGIATVTGAMGPVNKVVAAFAAGLLENSANTCTGKHMGQGCDAGEEK